MSDLKFDVPNCNSLNFTLEASYVGQGGTSDYNDLENKPTYEGITIEGDLTASGLGIATVTALESVSSDVDTLSTDVDTLETTVSGHTTSIATNTQNIQNNADNIATNTQAIQTNATNISANTTAIATNANAISGLQTALTTETTNRENADTGLQSQIDALTSKSDVVDIVGTYAQLQAYDTSSLGNNDIVKVLEDSTHDNTMSYYRWNATTQQWSYIGSEGAYYTKSESDSRFVPSTRTINNKALSANITLEASDIGAQEQLISGSNIKTINNESLLGSTNIELPTKAYVDSSVATKQDTLVSGTNIKTINSESLLGSGDIVLPTTTEIETLIASKLKAITNEEIDEIMGV